MVLLAMRMVADVTETRNIIPSLEFTEAPLVHTGLIVFRIRNDGKLSKNISMHK